MRTIWTRALVIAMAGMMLGLSSCILQNGDLVLSETVSVNLEETQTTGTFTTFTVADKFKEVLERKLQENGSGKRDVKSIHMVSATFKTTSVKPHDWTVDADINIARQDVPGDPYSDGPAPLVVFDDQALSALKGKPTDADLLADGVAVVDRALQSLLLGEDPRLVLVLENASVTPTPSTTDPMEFRIMVSVTFQMVVAVGNKQK